MFAWQTSEVVMIVLFSKPIFLLLTFVFIARNLRRGEAPPRPSMLPSGSEQRARLALGEEGRLRVEAGEGR